jgi:D-lactate dehydrogenase (cytochrome)
MNFQDILPNYEDYCRDESRLRGFAEKIAFPRCIDEIADTVKLAGDLGLRVTAQGARTGVVGGAAPQGGLVVSAARMNRISDLDRAGDGAFILRAQAGVSLKHIEDFLRRPLPLEGWDGRSVKLLAEMARGPAQMFAPNPGEATATVGGLFACDAKGINSLRWGGVGANTEGIAWVSPTGEVWRARRGDFQFDGQGCGLPGRGVLTCDTGLPHGGFAAMRPSPGLDLVDFLAGSEGAAGVLAEIELKLRPKPSEFWGVVFFFREDVDAWDFAESLLQWRNTPLGGLLSAAEYFDHAVLSLVDENRGRIDALKALPGIPSEAGAALYVTMEGGDPDSIEAALGELMELFAACGGAEDDTWAAASRAEAEIFNVFRHSAPEIINSEIDRIRLFFPELCKTASDFCGPARLARKYREMYREAARGNALPCFVFGHILENRLHVNFLPRDEAQLDACRSLISDWAGRVAADGGLLAGENGAGKIKRFLLRDHMPLERKDQLRSIFEQLDPGGLFSFAFDEAFE